MTTRVTQTAGARFVILPLTYFKLDVVPSVDLGDESRSRQVNQFLAHISARDAADACIVIWMGSKIPRGVLVDGAPVTWTQNGVVGGAAGQLGTYTRLVEFGRPVVRPAEDLPRALQPDEQWMVIYPAS